MVRVTPTQPRYEIVNFTGGLNEQVANLELTPGELTECNNYIERDDVYGGYESIKGYERFDGRTKPSSVPASSALDDAAREAARSAITALPGSGGVRGIFSFADKVYGVRNDSTPTYKNVFVESVTGWSQVAAFNTKLTHGGKVRTVSGRFTDYNSGDTVMIMTDEVSNAQIFNGTAVTTIPEPDAGLGFPTNVALFKNRLILVYPKGNIVFSSVGDPTDFNTATGTAGRIKIGDEITSIQETKGGVLVIATLNSIKMMYYGGTSDDETFVFKLDTFSDSLGSQPDTMKSLAGTTMFADVTGVTNLVAVDTFGDFRENNLTKKAQRSFDSAKIVGAVTDRERGRYIIFFADASRSYALVLVMKGQRVKSITKANYSIPITHVSDIVYSNGDEYIFFGSSSGMVYQGCVGTSHDGAAIISSLTTAYYHYKSPRIWKRFSKLYFEISATSTFSVSVNPKYNYNQQNLPTAVAEEGLGSVSNSENAIWGSATWGNFTWKRGETESSNVYISGYGSNMAVSLASSSKYAQPHVLYNMQVSFTLNSQNL